MKKLSPIQSRVLAELAWNARLTVSEVAKKLKVRGDTVHYSIDRLKHYLKLQPVCFTDPYRQGQTPFRVYFSTNSSDEAATQKLIDYIAKRPDVHWFSALLGYYQFGMSLRAPSLARLEEIFAELDRECPGIVREKTISVISSIQFFVPWAAHTGTGPRKSFSYRAGVEEVPLDKVDWDILHELRRDPVASTRKIAQVTGIAASTVGYRLQKLLASGVIVGFGNSCDSRTVHQESHLLFISTKGFGAEAFERLSVAASRHPSVVWIGRTLGQSDFEMEVRVESPAEVDDVIRLIYKTGQGAVTKVTSQAWGQNHIW
jgi:DNA-binding Lrp family transcriptional regulator